MLGFHPRYVRWTIAVLPALMAPAVSLFILLTGLNQTAPAGSTKTAVPLREAATQPQSTPTADVRAPMVTTNPQGQPATSVPSSGATSTDQFTLPERGVPTVRSVPVLFNRLTPTKVAAPTATPVPTRRPVNTATVSAPREPALVAPATSTVEPAKTKEPAPAAEPARTPEPDKNVEPDDKGKDDK